MIKGTWQIIQWCPDLVSREWLNIGVGFKVNGIQHIRYLDHFETIEELYDEDTKIHFIAVLEFVRNCLDSGFYDFSQQIKVIEIGFSKGISVDEILNDFYERVITLRKKTHRNEFHII